MNMKVILDLLCMVIIIVVITDISDWADTVKKAISYILTKGKIVKTDFRLHLIDCAFCQLFWAGIIYLLCTGNFTLPYIAVLCLLCAFTGVVEKYIILIEDITIKITQLIYKLIDR